MASHLLGITGKKRAGKDTFAARLVEVHGFTRVAFADSLKAVALDLDPIIQADATKGYEYGYGGEVFDKPGEPDLIRLSDIVNRQGYGWETAKDLPEVRRLLQELGVAVREHIHDDVWVEAALVKIARVPGPVVVTDVRFPNEAEMIRTRCGKIARVFRSISAGADSHVSETALDHLCPDYSIRNDSSIAALHAEADSVAADLLRR